MATHVSGELAGTRAEAVGSLQRRHDVALRSTGDPGDRGGQRTERSRAGLHQRDAELGVITPQPRDETGLHRARLPGATRTHDGGEAPLAGDPLDEPLDELFLSEEAPMIGLAERTQADVRIVEGCGGTVRRLGGRRCIQLRVLQQDLLFQSTQPG